MKRIVIFSVAMFSLLFSFAQNQDIAGFYEKYEGKEGFTTIDLNGSLFTSLFGGKKHHTDDKKHHKVFRFRLISTDFAEASINPRDIRQLKSDLQRGPYEELMTIRDAGTYVDFLVREKGPIIQELLMVVDEKEGFTLISFEGEIHRDKLNKFCEDIEMDIEGWEYMAHLDEHVK